MRRIALCAVVVLAIAGCDRGEKPAQVRAEASELRNNHARTVADVAERDLRLRDLARQDKASATSAALDQAIAADAGEVDYLLSVYDDRTSPEAFAVEAGTVARLRALHAPLHAAATAAGVQPKPVAPVANPKKKTLR